MAKGNLISRAMREVAKRRTHLSRRKRRREPGRAYWDRLTPSERSAEMKRRAAKRKKKAKR